MPDLIKFLPSWVTCAQEMAINQLALPKGECVFANEPCFNTDIATRKIDEQHQKRDLYLTGSHVVAMAENDLAGTPPHPATITATIKKVAYVFLTETLPALVTDTAQSFARNITAPALVAAASHIFQECVLKGAGSQLEIAST